MEYKLTVVCNPNMVNYLQSLLDDFSEINFVTSLNTPDDVIENSNLFIVLCEIDWYDNKENSMAYYSGIDWMMQTRIKWGEITPCHFISHAKYSIIRSGRHDSNYFELKENNFTELYQENPKDEILSVIQKSKNEEFKKDYIRELARNYLEWQDNLEAFNYSHGESFNASLNDLICGLPKVIPWINYIKEPNNLLVEKINSFKANKSVAFELAKRLFTEIDFSCFEMNKNLTRDDYYSFFQNFKKIRKK